MSRPRAGIERIASPAMPAAATNVVASTATDPVTSEAPAVALGATNGVQASVPRSISVSDIHCVVDAGGLDEVEERRADPAEHEQRDHPPQHGQHDAQRPPRGEPPPQPVGPVTGQPDHRGQAARQRRDRVDRTHQRDRHRRPGGQHPHLPVSRAARGSPAAAPTAPASSAASPTRSRRAWSAPAGTARTPLRR